MFYSIRLFIKVSWIVKCCIMIRIGGVHQHGWRQCYHLYTQCDFFFFFGKFNWRSFEWWCLSKLSTSHCVLNTILETTSSMWQHQYINEDWLVIYLLTANEMPEVLPPLPSPHSLYIYFDAKYAELCVCVFFFENIRNLIQKLETCIVYLKIYFFIFSFVHIFRKYMLKEYRKRWNRNNNEVNFCRYLKYFKI